MKLQLQKWPGNTGRPPVAIRAGLLLAVRTIGNMRHISLCLLESLKYVVSNLHYLKSGDT